MNEQQTNQFDRNGTFELGYLGESGEELSLTVKVPSDDQFIAREKKVRSVTFADGKKRVYGLEEANSELLGQLVTDASPTSDDAAYFIIPELTRCEVMKSERGEADLTTIRVEMTVTAELPVVHILKIAKPSDTEWFKLNYERPVKPGRAGETPDAGFDFPVFRTLFKKLFVSAEGYPANTIENIPIWHQVQSVLIAAFFRMRETRELQARSSFR